MTCRTRVLILDGFFGGGEFPADEVLPPPEVVFRLDEIAADYGAYEVGTRCRVVSVAANTKRYRLGDVYEYDGRRWNLT